MLVVVKTNHLTMFFEHLRFLHFVIKQKNHQGFHLVVILKLIKFTKKKKSFFIVAQPTFIKKIN